MKISITVPIYKVEEYLPQCIESIINQTYTDIEILLIDDGSPDRCGAICDEYATKDSRIKVFHIPNGGVAKARQFGVENSTGEFIVFVDSDDWIPANSVETLYSNISSDIDLVVGSFSRYEKSKETGQYTKLKDIDRNRYSKSGVYNNNQYFKLLLERDVLVAPWAKIYRRKLFTSDSFPPRKSAQDFLMNLEVCSRVQNVKHIKDPIYNYLHRETSTIGSLKYSFESQMELNATILNQLKGKRVFEKYKVSYYICVLKSLQALVSRNIFIDKRHPIIIGMLDTLKGEKLTYKSTITILSIRYPFIQRVIQFLKKRKSR